LIVTSKTLVVAASILWGLVAYANLSPLGVRPTVAAQSTFEHTAAFAALGLAFSLAYPRHAWLAAAIVVGSAALLELLQLYTPDRHARWLDVFEKTSGGCIGLAAGRLALQVHRTVQSWR
jgi:VanZ family protein